MSYYNSEQAAQLKDIGQYLQQQRTSQKLTLEDIAEQTFISLRILEALEEGDATKLPAKVYVQGFIRRYADVLGLDGQELSKTLSEIPDELPTTTAHQSSVAKEQAIATIASQLSATSDTQTLEPSQSQRTPSTSSRPNPSKKKNILPLLLGFGIIAGLGGYWFMSRFEPSSNPIVQQETPTLTTKAKTSPIPSPVASPVVSPSPVASPTPSPVTTSNASLALNIVITSESWLKVVTDGETAYEGVLEEGAEKTWEADNAIEIRAGNAGGVQIGLNGSSPEPLGELGKVKEATFKAETL